MTEAGPADIAALDAALARMGLLAPGEAARYTALTGGVASDIWKVDTAAKTFAVKRALPKLKVVTDWYVSVARNAFEVKWMEVVRGIMPQAVPQLLGHDPAAGLFAMAYLDPATYRNWKVDLRDGRPNDALCVSMRPPRGIQPSLPHSRPTRPFTPSAWRPIWKPRRRNIRKPPTL